MAREDFKLRAIIEADNQASGPIRDADSSVSGLGATFSKFRVGLLAVTAAVSGFVAGIVAAVTAAAEQEAALNQLTAAADKFGSASDGIVASAAEQASELQKLTGIGDELIISQQAVLLQMGVLPGQLEEATLAAVNLSKALGIDTESAFRNIGKTMGGFAGELGELIPELKELSAEQLKAGEGVTLLSAKFAGTAEKTRGLKESFGGLSAAVGDFAESVGETINQGGALQKVVDFLTASIGQLTAQMQSLTQEASLAQQALDLQQVLVSTTGQTISFAEALARVRKEAEEVAKIEDTLAQGARAWAESLQGVERDQVFANALTLVKTLGISWEEAFDKIRKSLERTSDAQDRFTSGLTDLETSLAAVGVEAEDYNQTLDDLFDTFEKVEAAERANIITQERAAQLRAELNAKIDETIAKRDGESAAVETNTGKTDANTAAKKANAAASGEEAAGIDSVVEALNRESAARDTIGRQDADSLGIGLEGTFEFIDTSAAAQRTADRLRADRDRRL